MQKHGLPVIGPSNNRGKNYKDFLIKIETLGYEIKKGKYLPFKAKEQGTFACRKTLG